MSVLICGSMAYDTIMRFEGRFAEHILPDELDTLNVSFLAPQLRREFGGCAGNVAYGLARLGETGYPMAMVGRDFNAYRDWLEHQRVPQRFVRAVPDAYTSQAFITTDADGNQLSAFHPGAMERCHEQAVPTDAGVRIGVISPESRAGMVAHAEQMAAADIPFLFDPGQGVTMFGRDEFLRFVEQATWTACNEYECRLLQEKSGLGLGPLAERLEAVIVTRGAQGSAIHRPGREPLRIPAAAAARAADPTGCGDAYRAGLLFGLLRGMDWETCGRFGSLLGAAAVADEGCQHYVLDRDALYARFREEFGYAPD